MNGERQDVGVDVDRLVAAVCDAGGVALGRSMVALGEPSAEWAHEAAEATGLRLAASLESVVPGAGVAGHPAPAQDRTESAAWVSRAICGLDDYASGFPGWCVSAGLVTWLGVVAGVVYLPALGDVYVFLDGSCTWRTRPVSVSDDARLSDHSTILVPPSAASLAAVLPGRRRCIGPATTHMLYVARGVASAGVTDAVSADELAVALPFLRAAGGEACYLSGAPVSLSELLDGRPAPGPVVFAARQLLEEARLGFGHATPTADQRPRDGR
jgi:fructose-1,6-bisphosphatase/inositol monophosphatase family enzyme